MRRRLIVLAVFLVAVVVVAWLVLPVILRNAINSSLASNESYDGSVGGVGVNLFDASATLHDVRVVSVAPDAALERMTAQAVHVDLAFWSSLFRLTATAQVGMRSPDIVARVPEEPAEEGPPLREQLADLPDFDVGVALQDGRITVIDGTKELVLGDVDASVEGLTNLPEHDPLRAQLSTTFAGGGALTAQGTADLMAASPQGQGQLDLVGLELAPLSAWLRESGFGFTTGTMDAHLQAAVQPVPGEAPPGLVYQGFDLRTLDLELDVAIANVRPDTEDLPGRNVLVPEGALSVVWHPEQMDRIEITGSLSGPTAEVNREGATAQLGDGEEDREVQPSPLAGLPPFELLRFQVNNGHVSLSDSTVEPAAAADVHDLEVTLTNLSNAPGQLAELVVTGELAGGELTIEGEFDPLADLPELTVDARVVGLQLAKINDVLRGYADLDVARGTVSLYAEVATSDRDVTGYVKVLMDRAEFFTRRDWREGAGALWEALVGTGAEILENQPRARTAVQLRLDGTLEQPDPDVSQALLSILRNAFIRALLPGLGDTVELGDVAG